VTAVRRLLVLLLVLPLAVSASASTATAKPLEPRTLVRSATSIYAFAQSRDALAWVSADGRVRVKRISSGRTWVVGRVDRAYLASSAVLALAGTRALWAWDTGGNSY
jgi:hypothetical protein